LENVNATTVAGYGLRERRRPALWDVTRHAVASTAMKRPATFKTEEPSYLVASSTPGSVNARRRPAERCGQLVHVGVIVSLDGIVTWTGVDAARDVEGSLTLFRLRRYGGAEEW
jgi:hypothetical protein